MGELRLYGPDLAEFTMVDTVQLRTWWEEAQPEGPPIGQILEAPSFVFSGNGTRIAYSDATSHRVEVLENGVLSLIIVEDRSRIPFEPDSIPDYMSGAADSLPAYRSLVVDSDRRIWLESSEHSGGEDGTVWRLVSADGSSIQRITIPATGMVLDARGDRVLLLERDNLDVENAVVRQLH
jgi:hypothetical protein